MTNVQMKDLSPEEDALAEQNGWITERKVLKFRPRMSKEQRLKVIEEYYGGCSLSELAVRCGVSKMTVSTDLRVWRDSDRYDAWLEDRWLKYLNADTIPDTMKFMALTRLKERQIMRVAIKDGIAKQTIKITWANEAKDNQADNRILNVEDNKKDEDDEDDD